MTLHEIALGAIDAALGDAMDEALGDNVVKTENEDGTYDLAFSFSLDPKVVAENSKAMEKGVEREDLSDTLGNADDGEGDGGDGESDDEEDEDEDPYNGVDVTDSADTVFMDALDAIDGEAQDARANSRHSQTPLENCRARDPRFCPYHGIPAWTRQIEGDLAAKGVNGKVEVTKDDTAFSVKIANIDSGTDPQKVSDVINGIFGITGVIEGRAIPMSGQEATAQFQTDWDAVDLPGRLNDWVDDYIADYGIDPNCEVDFDDFNALLEAQEDLEAFEKQMDPNDANDKQAFKDMVKKAESMYHSLVAQQYFSDITDGQMADDKATELGNEADDLVSRIDKVRQEATAAKRAIFGNAKGQFPSANAKKGIPKFTVANPWAADYTRRSSNMHNRHEDYLNALAAFQNANNLKEQRAALAEIDYARESLENSLPKFEQVQKQFMKDLYDWTAKDPQYSANLSAAFPNGRPQ